MPDLHVVLGAGGGIGGAVTRMLAGEGRRVRAVSRRAVDGLPDGVATHHADLTDNDAAREACTGAAVVFHCAQPAYHRWAQDFPPLNAAIVAAAAAAGARLVLADNLYMYAPVDTPIGEATPERPSSRKGEVRRRMGADLLAEHAAGRLWVTLGRATDYFGPGGIGSLSGESLFGAAVAGKPVRWPGNVDIPHAQVFLPDLARCLVALGDHDEAGGRAWVLPSTTEMTPRESVAMVGEALGREVKIVPTGKLMMRIAGLFIPPARELPDIWDQFTHPWRVDARGFQQAFGPVTPTDPRAAIEQTVAWWRERG